MSVMDLMIITRREIKRKRPEKKKTKNSSEINVRLPEINPLWPTPDPEKLYKRTT